MPKPKSPSAVSWDGRLMFGTKRICKMPFEDEPEGEECTADTAQVPGGVIKKELHVWVFKPEIFLEDASGIDLFNYFAFSPPHVLDNDPYIEPNTYPIISVPSKSDTEGRLSLTVYANPSFPVNPYSSDSSGNPIIGGLYETYQVYILGSMQCTVDSNRMTNDNGTPYHCEEQYPPYTSADKKFISITQAQVVVNSPSSFFASIDSTQILNSGQGEMLTWGSGSPIYGFEPSVSLDGRLLVFNGRTDAGKGGSIQYTFNNNPGQSSGWSEPRPITSMYATEKVGTSQETRVGVGQVLFSDLYPIAKRPLLSPDGVELGDGRMFPGAYPWLSFDSSDITFSLIPNFNSARRSGFAITGQLTNWTTQLVDGPANPARGNVKPVIGGAGQPELTELYRTKFGSTTWQRHTPGALGLTGTMWDRNLKGPQTKLPLLKEEPTYQLAFAFSGDYIEVPMNSVVDGGYIVRWPLNELIEYDRGAIDDENQNIDYSVSKRKAAVYDSNGTPDISGHHWNGTLTDSQAQFPFEFYDASSIWDESIPGLLSTDPNDLKDVTEGRSGNSVFFSGTGSIESVPLSNLPSESSSSILAHLMEIEHKQSFTISFWLRAIGSVSDVKLLDISGLAEIRIDGAGSISASILGTNNTPLITSASSILADEWVHVSLVVEDGTALLYVNGIAVKQEPLLHPISILADPTQNFSITVGSLDGQPSQSINIDEFAFSSVARSVQEIRVSAFIRDEVEVTSNFAPIIVPSEYDALPLVLADHRDTNGANLQDVIALGKDLFNSTLLSEPIPPNVAVSCASCHDEDKSFADDTVQSIGAGGLTTRNTPSLINRIFGSQHMLDGRAGSLEEQVVLPMTNPLEMNLPPDLAVSRLEIDSNFGPRFQNIFQRTVNEHDLVFAIASYVRSLILDPNTPVSTGRDIFEGKGRCIACHNGPNFTNEQFHNIGLGVTDPGRGAITGRDADLGKFRTPSLWNVKDTGPYFHDGRFINLMEVIDFYNRGGDSTINLDFRIRPLGLTTAEKGQLFQYIESLTGTVP